MKKPRILIFDIETRYILFRGWRTGKQWVDQSQIVEGEDQDIICIAYTWLGSKKVHALDWGLKKQNSARMIQQFSEIVESADAAIGHNSDNFDVRHINTQRLLKGQPPISWPTMEDSLKMLKKQFYLPSYRLDYIAKLLTGSGKKTMNFADWVEVVEKKSRPHLNKMIKYCKRDVAKLAEIIERTSPYITLKANRALMLGNDKYACPSCGETRTQSKGIRYGANAICQRRRCKSCGRTFSAAFPKITKKSDFPK